MRWIHILLLFIPISIGVHFAHVGGPWAFITAALAVVPLAGLMGEATEELAHRYGSSVGGLLNATFGNAAELIIGISAVRAGELDLVRASIVGSIIGNILLVFGLAALAGGIKRKHQTFGEDAAGVHTVMLILAVIAIFTPTLFVHAIPGTPDTADNPAVEALSLWVAGILTVIYLGGLAFSLITHRDMFTDSTHGPAVSPNWSRRKAIAVLAGATTLVAIESELLVHSVGTAVEAWGLNKLFLGIIVLPIIGNAAEHGTAVTAAIKNKMDISFNICITSSTQIALFVAPLLVFLSIPMGHAMPFIFNQFELIALGFTVVIAAFIARDGRCNWLEGAQLLAVYLILGLAFYYIPR